MAVSRRTVLRTSLAALSLGVSATRGWAAANRTDVIVIGAGFAGLNAAAQLRDQGLRVLVLEAARRPGGRSHTAHHLDSRIELGASQIGPMYARVRDVATRLGVKLSPGAHINAPYCYVLGEQIIGAKAWTASPHNQSA